VSCASCSTALTVTSGRLATGVVAIFVVERAVCCFAV
jgi:hypothetical protein